MIKRIPAKKMFIAAMIIAVTLNLIGLATSNTKLFFDASIILLGIAIIIRPSLGLEYLKEERKKKGDLFDLVFPDKVYVLIGFFGGIVAVAFGLLDYFRII